MKIATPARSSFDLKPAWGYSLPMIGFFSSKSRFSVILLIMVWFFVWGFCPWDNDSVLAQTSKAVHATHGHQETDGTHHATKGVEHSCSASITLSKQMSNWGESPLKPLPGNDSSIFIVLPTQSDQPYNLSLSLSRQPKLSKRYSNLYQLNQSFRL